MVLAVVLCAGVAVQSCKNKDNKTDTTTTTTTVDTPATYTPPVTVASDEALRKGVMDATKDFSGVTATVQDSVIVLSGNINKKDNQRLTETLNSLRPKRIDRTNLKVN